MKGTPSSVVRPRRGMWWDLTIHTISRETGWGLGTKGCDCHRLMAFQVGKPSDYLWDWELTGEENISMETLKTTDHHAGNSAWTEGTDSETQGHLPTAASRIL